MNQPFNDLLAMWAPGPIELLVILIVAVLIFGKRIPEIGRSLGKSLTEFKKGINEAQNIKNDLTDEVKKVKNDIVTQVNDAAAPKDS